MMEIYDVSIETLIRTQNFIIILNGDNQLLYSRQPVHTVDAW
jgi:hypothetical protein